MIHHDLTGSLCWSSGVASINCSEMLLKVLALNKGQVVCNIMRCGLFEFGSGVIVMCSCVVRPLWLTGLL